MCSGPPSGILSLQQWLRGLSRYEALMEIAHWHIASNIVSTKVKKENTMRKVIVSEYVTLDGVMEDPGGAEGFKHGGWSFGFAAAWPNMPGTGAYGERMNSLPKYVASTTLSEVTWNATLIKGDLAEELSRLKQEAGQDVLIFGSGELVHTLHERDLIDEYRLMIFPLVLGSGKRLFPGGNEKKVLKLVETRTFGSGVVLLTYQPDKP